MVTFSPVWFGMTVPQLTLLAKDLWFGRNTASQSQEFSCSLLRSMTSCII